MFVAVGSAFQSTRRYELDGDNKSVWLVIRLTGGEELLIGAFYIPPDVPISSFSKLFTSIEEVCSSHPNHQHILLGDLNTPGVQWENRTYQHYNYYVQQKSAMILHVILDLMRHDFRL